jgi:eukaryotic-like serine/threonine-protein kinase
MSDVLTPGLLSVESLPPGLIVGEHFRLERLVGHGGFGSVYEAVDGRDHARRAVKVFHPGYFDTAERAQRLAQRIETVAKLVADNAIPSAEYVTAAAWQGETVIKVSDFADGLAFNDYVAELAFRPPEERASLSLGVVAQVARSLAEVNKRVPSFGADGLFHLALHPGNVIVRPSLRKVGGARDKTGMAPTVILTDLGIAGSFSLATVVSLYQSRKLSGYIAPELSWRGAEITPAADVWGVGALLHELLTGAAPNGGADTNLLAALEVPDEVIKLVARALSQEPTARYADALKVTLALESLVRGEGLPADADLEETYHSTPAEPPRTIVATPAMLSAGAAASTVGGAAAIASHPAVVGEMISPEAFTEAARTGHFAPVETPAPAPATAQPYAHSPPSPPPATTVLGAVPMPEANPTQSPPLPPPATTVMAAVGGLAPGAVAGAVAGAVTAALTGTKADERPTSSGGDPFASLEITPQTGSTQAVPAPGEVNQSGNVDATVDRARSAFAAFPMSVVEAEGHSMPATESEPLVPASPPVRPTSDGHRKPGETHAGLGMVNDRWMRESTRMLAPSDGNDAGADQVLARAPVASPGTLRDGEGAPVGMPSLIGSPVPPDLDVAGRPMPKSMGADLASRLDPGNYSTLSVVAAPGSVVALTAQGVAGPDYPAPNKPYVSPPLSPEEIAKANAAKLTPAEEKKAKRNLWIIVLVLAAFGLLVYLTLQGAASHNNLAGRGSGGGSLFRLFDRDPATTSRPPPRRPEQASEIAKEKPKPEPEVREIPQEPRDEEIPQPGLVGDVILKAPKEVGDLDVPMPEAPDPKANMQPVARPVRPIREVRNVDRAPDGHHDELMRQAINLRDEGAFKACIRTAGRVMTEFPSSEEPYPVAADCFRKQDKGEREMLTARDYLKRFPNGKYATEMKVLAK